MAESSIGAETAGVLDVDPDAFEAAVEAEAEVIKAEVERGTFDNPQGIVGLEYEFYAIGDPGRDDREDGAYGCLRRLPREILSLIGFEKELGLHNAELNTSPQPLNPEGLAAQEAEVCARISAAHERTRIEGIRLVSDAMWTIPPTGETARGYLTDSIEDGPITIATNMSDSARYHAMANTDAPAGMRIDAPNVTLEADTVMPESLITSIQPHYQVPHAPDLPEYFRYALRVAGPLLALGVNSPFFPPDLYDDGVEAEAVVEDAWMEHRITTFETVLNADGLRKVKFPRDLESIEAAVDRVVADETFVPIPVDGGDRFDDRFAHFRTKHGTYWRWVRPVFGGETRASANARIEFRPIPGQPTVRDAIAFQAAFAGLLEGMHARSHPVGDLDWRDARENFYAAVRDGLAADLEWITEAGDRTTETDRVFDDLLRTAAAGLRMRGFDDEQAARYLGPLRFRLRSRLTPARWKQRRVAERLESDEGLAEAIPAMQRAYFDRQAATLTEGSFAGWFDD